MVPFLWESSSETIGMVSSLLKDAIFSFSAKVHNVNSILTGCTQWTTLIRVRVGLSAKRLGGHLKKDKIIFQSSWLVVPLFPSIRFSFETLQRTLCNDGDKPSFQLNTTVKNVCHFRFRFFSKKTHKGIYLTYFFCVFV